MTRSFGPAFKQISARGIELRRKHAEIVVNGSALEQTLFDTATLAKFEILNLKDYAEALDEENSAQNGE